MFSQKLIKFTFLNASAKSSVIPRVILFLFSFSSFGLTICQISVCFLEWRPNDPAYVPFACVAPAAGKWHIGVVGLRVGLCRVELNFIYSFFCSHFVGLKPVACHWLNFVRTLFVRRIKISYSFPKNQNSNLFLLNFKTLISNEISFLTKRMTWRPTFWRLAKKRISKH